MARGACCARPRWPLQSANNARAAAALHRSHPLPSPCPTHTPQQEAALVAKLAGANKRELILETTAWGDGGECGGASGGGAAGALRAAEQQRRCAEALAQYAVEAPATLKSDKSKLQYIKGQYFAHGGPNPSLMTRSTQN